MKIMHFYLQLFVICLFLCVITADISASDLDDITKNIKEKSKDIKVGDVKDTIKKHPEFIKWKQRCIETAGRNTFKNIERSSSRMVSCFTKEIRIKTLQKEVNNSMDKGELDTVFKKYCGKRDKLMNCVDDMIDTIKQCSDDKEEKGLNITREFINAGIDFICHDDGDRIAIFMAEEGIECVNEHSDEIKHCIQEKVPELADFEPQNMMESVNPGDLSVNDDRCDDVSKIHRCVVVATEKCKDPTPANVLDSLFIQMRKVTPCAYTIKEAITSVRAHAPPSFHISHILPLVLTLFTAALTAANLLL